MSKFDTVIDAHGPNGNTMFILAATVGLMKSFAVAPDEISALRDKVFNSKSRADALAAIREWFPVETDDGT